MRSITLSLFLLVLAGTPVFAAETQEQLEQQVRETEAAFATTMAKRDLDAFASYIAEEAVFFSGKDTLRGKTAVVDGWKPLYRDEKPPFSWRPETVAVLASGTLAHSSGPVFDAQGAQVGTFISVWRREADGKWKIVLDKGCSACACAEKKQD